MNNIWIDPQKKNEPLIKKGPFHYKSLISGNNIMFSRKSEARLKMLKIEPKCDKSKVYEDLILKELDYLFETGLSNPRDLIFHTIFLSEDEDGEIVMISGIEDNSNESHVFAEYVENPEWIILKPNEG